jgi:hypothetical protein
MPREASTSARSEEIILQLTSPNSRGAVKLEAYSETDAAYEVINDLDVTKGVDWTEAGKKEKYANFGLTPLPGTIKFNVINKNGKFSDGSGTRFEGRIAQETKVRLSAGHILSTGADAVETAIDLNDTSGLLIGSYYHNTVYTSDTSNDFVEMQDGNSVSATGDIHFKDRINFYDALNYDSATYSIDAYTVQTYDTGGEDYESISKFVANCNNTKGEIFYRFFNDYNEVGESLYDQWTSGGATVDGNKTVTVSSKKRFMQVAIVYDGLSSWNQDLRLNDITVTSQSFVEFIFTSVYYLDRPKFTDPAAPDMPVIVCSGRDAYKRAVGTDINISDLSTFGTAGGTPIDDVIRDVCDKINISYSSTSIDDLFEFPLRTWANGVQNIKADKVFEYCMQILNKTGYLMYLEYDSTLDDNIMFITAKPTSSVAEGALNFQNYISIGDTSKNSDRLLNRLTVLTSSESIADEGLLGSDSYTTNGTKTIVWASGNREFKRLVISPLDNVTVSDLVFTPSSATFTLSGIVGTIYADVYGSAWSGDTPTAEGEAADATNHLNSKGVTTKLVNPLIISNAEAKDTAESFVSDYGTPFIEARSLTWPYMNLFWRLRDQLFLWRRFIFTNDVFFITKIQHHWDSASTPNEWTVYNLEDSGFDSADPEWDDDVTKWDRGFVWDMGISTPLSTDAEIDAATTIINNVGVQ